MDGHDTLILSHENNPPANKVQAGNEEKRRGQAIENCLLFGTAPVHISA